MKKIIKKYQIVYPILVLFYFNFYFLSPFIHEHPLELAGQVETENRLHSYLKSTINLNSNNTDYVSNAVTSHTHNYSFDKPIIIQSSQKFIPIFTYCFIWPRDKYYNELEVEINLKYIPKLLNQTLWEKYVHFASNNSPPVLTA